MTNNAYKHMAAGLVFLMVLILFAVVNFAVFQFVLSCFGAYCAGTWARQQCHQRWPLDSGSK